ncbi:MAG: phage protein Gp27 family protein [Burkholderiaceae bacterium]
MPPVATLSSLPAKLRIQLDERLRASGFDDLEEIAAWLVEQGFDVSKSTVRLYAVRLKRAQEIDLAESLGLNDVGVVKLRLQCAAIAASAGGDDLFGLADQVLGWAVEPVSEALE